MEIAERILQHISKALEACLCAPVLHVFAIHSEVLTRWCNNSSSVVTAA
jgi:hypothetical protein